MDKEPEGEELTDIDADNLDEIVGVIGDWAEQKGWQGKAPTEESLQVARLIATKMEVIAVICQDIERIRKGEPPMLYTEPYTGSDLKALKLSKIGLMATELAEMAAAVETDIWEDDKVSELTGEAAELADVNIRVCQYASEFDIELGQATMLKHNFNRSRPHKHGKLA